MIRVKRLARPAFYRSDAVAKYERAMERFYAEFSAHDQRSFVIGPQRGGIMRNIHKALSENFNGKCAYCESITDGEVDQFRPKNAARSLDRKVDGLHYWWLSTTWENQYFCCPTCNRNKGNWFPVAGDRAPVGTPYPQIYDERFLLVDPCFDEPSQHLLFTPDGGVHPRSEKGDITIGLLKLNRRELIERRMQAFNETLLIARSLRNGNISRSVRELVENLDLIRRGRSKSSYLAVRRLAIDESHKAKVFISSLTSDASDVIKHVRKQQFIGNAYVTEVNIRNFKSIKELKFGVSDTAASKGLAPWTVLIGENGLGKSSILQAICLGLIDPDFSNRLLSAPHFLKTKSTKGSVDVQLDNQTTTKLEISRTQKKFKSNYKEVPNYVIAYGSTRLPRQGALKIDPGSTYFKVKNLFDHTAAIKDAESWLLKIKDDKTFAGAARIIKQALALDNSYKLKRDGRRIFFQRGKSELPLDQMSDGYKSTISLIVDIISVLSRKTDSFERIEGIVFIDELELHLHPRWKMKFIKSFRTAFPNIQVFATTHDPLCLKGLYKGEVILLKEVNRTNKIFTELPDVSLLKSEQLLTSEFFGLSSTIDPDEEALFDRYYLLLSKKVLTDKEEIEKRELKEKLPVSIQLGDSLRDDLILTSIDTMVAKQYKSGNISTRQDLKDSVKQFVSSVLKKKS